MQANGVKVPDTTLNQMLHEKQKNKANRTKIVIMCDGMEQTGNFIS